jgi:hypothetical protein
MKHIIMVNFREDAEPDAVGAFLDQAAKSLSRGPFKSVVFGAGEKVFASSMDWGFVADVDSAEDVNVWSACAAHDEMLAKLQPIVGSLSTMSMPEAVRAAGPDEVEKVKQTGAAQ